jgi:hypothetical protein
VKLDLPPVYSKSKKWRFAAGAKFASVGRFVVTFDGLELF